MGPVGELMKHMEQESGTYAEVDRHSKPSVQKDVEVMVKQLKTAKSLANVYKHRKLHAYAHYTPMLWKISPAALEKWLKQASKESLIL